MKTCFDLTLPARENGAATSPVHKVRGVPGLVRLHKPSEPKRPSRQAPQVQGALVRIGALAELEVRLD